MFHILFQSAVIAVTTSCQCFTRFAFFPIGNKPRFWEQHGDIHSWKFTLRCCWRPRCSTPEKNRQHICKFASWKLVSLLQEKISINDHSGDFLCFSSSQQIFMFGSKPKVNWSTNKSCVFIQRLIYLIPLWDRPKSIETYWDLLTKRKTLKIAS